MDNGRAGDASKGPWNRPADNPPPPPPAQSTSMSMDLLRKTASTSDRYLVAAEIVVCVAALLSAHVLQVVILDRLLLLILIIALVSLSITRPLFLLITVLGYMSLEGFLARAGVADTTVVIMREFLVVICLAGAILSKPRKMLSIRPPWIYLFVLACSTILAHDQIRALLAGRYYLLWPMLGVVSRIFISTTRRFRFFMAVTVLIGVINSLVALYQYATGYGGQITASSAEFMTIYRFSTLGGVGLTVGRPVLGLLLAVLLPVAIWFTLSETRMALRLVSLAAGGVLVGGLVVTLSRSAWVAAFVGCVVVLQRLRPVGRVVLAAIWCVVGLTVVIWLPQQQAALGPFNEALSSTSSWGDRINLWQTTIVPLLDSPGRFLFGNGLGSVGGPIIGGTKSGVLPNADSSYIRLIVETGVMGVLGVAYLASLGLRSLRGLDRGLGTLALAVVSVLATGFVGVDGVFYLPAVPIAASILGALGAQKAITMFAETRGLTGRQTHLELATATDGS